MSEVKRATIEKVVRLNKSMSGLGVVTVTIRDRKQTKIEGVVFRSRLDGRKHRQLRDGESPLHYTIRTRAGSEHEVAVDRMAKVSLREPRHLEAMD